MATCDPATLLNSGACFSGLNERELKLVQSQLLCEIKDAGGGGGGGGVWGGITGTLSNQTDLQTALDHKLSSLATGLFSRWASTKLSGATAFGAIAYEQEARITFAPTNASSYRLACGYYGNRFSGNYNRAYLDDPFSATFTLSVENAGTQYTGCIYLPGADNETSTQIGRAGIAVEVVGKATGNAAVILAVHNGTTRTAASEYVLPGATGDNHVICVVWKPGVTATLYVNNEEKAEISSGLPSGDLSSGRFVSSVLNLDAGSTTYTTMALHSIFVTRFIS